MPMSEWRTQLCEIIIVNCVPPSRELLLIEGISLHGLGNWAAIAEHVGTRTKEEVEETPSAPESESSDKSKNGRPNKSLNEILGIKKQDTSEIPRVAVVIDPRLAKVLRPHQIEGVKVRLDCVFMLVGMTLTRW